MLVTMGLMGSIPTSSTFYSIATALFKINNCIQVIGTGMTYKFRKLWFNPYSTIFKDYKRIKKSFQLRKSNIAQKNETDTNLISQIDITLEKHNALKQARGL